MPPLAVPLAAGCEEALQGFSFRVERSTAFGEGGPRDVVHAFPYGMTRPRPLPLRWAPSLRLGADGAPWLLSGSDGAGHWEEGRFVVVPLAAAQCERVVDVAPIAGGGVLVLGVQGEQNVLARLAADGRALWRRVGPRDFRGRPGARLDFDTLRGDFEDLLSDRDRTFYLSGTRLEGRLARVDLASGALAPAVDLPGYDATVQLRAGVLYRVLYREPRRLWVSRELPSGADRELRTDPALYGPLAIPLEPLADGGALLLDEHGALLWMSPAGQLRARLPLAGVARSGEEAVVALRGRRGLCATRWSQGLAVASVALEVPESARLASAEENGVQVYEPAQEQFRNGTLRRFEWSGRELPSVALDEQPEALGRVQSACNLRTARSDDAGALLLACADARGVFVLRGAPR